MTIDSVDMFTDTEFPNLVNLTLNSVDLNSAMLAKLVNIRAPKLIFFDVQRNALGARALEILMNSSLVQQLEGIGFTNTNLTAAGLERMAEMELPKLKRLVLGRVHCEI